MQIKKQWLISLMLIIGYSQFSSADVNQNYNTNATAFAIEAGSIAGAAQACGQDISVFQKRVGEALAKLSQNPQDNVFAMSAFQKAMDHAQQVQKNGQPIPCTQVAQDYNNLPIMRPDYTQTVLTQLSPNMGNPNPNPNPSAGTGQVQNGNYPSNPAPIGGFPQTTPPQIQQPPGMPNTSFNQSAPPSANMTPPPASNVPPTVGPTNLYNQQSTIPPQPASPITNNQAYPTSTPTQPSSQPTPNPFGQSTPQQQYQSAQQPGQPVTQP